MFMIHTPQSIDLLAIPLEDPAAVPSADGSEPQPEHHGTISFDHEGDDVSKCRMIITRDDKVFTYTFNTRGNLLSSTYDDDKTREAKAAKAKAAKDAEDAAEAVAKPDENVRETESANQPAI
jgi:hypothetical protein